MLLIRWFAFDNNMSIIKSTSLKVKEGIKIKNEYVAVLLAALLGVIGFLGIGHFYTGRFRRGIILIIVGWLIIGIDFVLFALWSMSGMVIPPPGYTKVEPPAFTAAFLITAIVLFLGFGGLWIWQILDARAKCRAYNSHISQQSLE